MPRLDYDMTSSKQVAGFPFKEAEKRTPNGLAQTLIIIPMSIGVGLVVTLGIAMMYWGLGASGKLAWVAGGLAMVCCILFGFWRTWEDEIYMTVERITGHDLNQDGYIGPPPSTHIEFAASDRTRWRADLPAPPELILEWGEAALNGHSLGYRQWKNRFALLPDGSDGDKRYALFREALVRSQLAIEQGKHGITLTDRGIQQFTEHVYQRPQGTPLLEG